MKYKVYNFGNITTLPQFDKLSKDYLDSLAVVSKVFPFKVSNYVTEELIDWNNLENDPIFRLTFPQKGMLSENHYNHIQSLIKQNVEGNELKNGINSIRLELNPHPAGQLTLNIPRMDDMLLNGIQHKYDETVLFFPNAGQTCHSYCTFCFRWAQFVGIDYLKMAMQESNLLNNYLRKNLSVTDLLFTGGDPMIMSTDVLKRYLKPIIDDMQHNLQTIRLGTKALAFWPQRFLEDKDSSELLRLFEKIIKKNYNLVVVAHISHFRELETPIVQDAIRQIRNTGAQIYTQSPILKGINDDSNTWSKMWRQQVNLNCVPYYMFIPRDTGASFYFEVSLENAWKIFKEAYSSLSGICKTAKGPVMSTTNGKIQILGVSQIGRKKVFTLQYVQARRKERINIPFFAKYDKNATWITDLDPFDKTAEDMFSFK